MRGTTTRKFMTSIKWSIAHEDTWLHNSWPQKKILKNCPTARDTLLRQLQSTISISPNYSQLILLASLIHLKLQYLQAKSKYCPLMELPFSDQPFHSMKKRIIHYSFLPWWKFVVFFSIIGILYPKNQIALFLLNSICNVPSDKNKQTNKQSEKTYVKRKEIPWYSVLGKVQKSM